MGGVHFMVLIYLIVVTDIINGGNTYGSSTVSSSTKATLPVSAVSSISNAPPTIASRNNSRYIGLTTASTFTSISSTTPSSISSIASTTSRDRDNKLMSVLQARRSALTIPSRDTRWREKHMKETVQIQNSRSSNSNTNCDKQCSNEARFTSRECMRNCLASYDYHNNNVRQTNRFNQTRHKNIVMNIRNSNRNRNQDDSTPEMNLITNNQDELLEVDESIKGEIMVHPHTSGGGTRKSNQNNFNSQPTKETLRRVSNKTENTRNKPIRHEPFSNAVDSNRAMTSSTTKTTYYEYHTKNMDRSPRIQNKMFNSSTDRYTDVTDSGPYLFFGQKLPLTSKSNTEIRNQVIEQRKSKVKLDPEIVIESAPKISSTEKSRTWNTRGHHPSRNVVAYNNYLRRLSPLQDSTTARPLDVPPTTEVSVVKYHTNHPEMRISMKIKPAPVNVTTMASVYNLAEGEVDKKIVHSRSTVNATEVENSKLLDPQVVTHKPFPTKSVQILSSPDRSSIFQPSKRPGIIINIPEYATPEVVLFPETQAPKDISGSGNHVSNVYFNHHPLYYDTGTTEPISPHTEIVRMTEANHLDLEDTRNHVSIPDINHIFQNISSFTTQATTPSSTTEIVIVSGPISSSTSKSVSRTTISTSVKSTTNPQLIDVLTSTARPEVITDTGQKWSNKNFIPTTSSPATTMTPKAVKKSPAATVAPTIAADINQLADSTPSETTELNVLHKVVSETNFKPILSSVFPKLSEPTTKTSAAMNYSIFMATLNATALSKKPVNTVYDGVLLHQNNDVMIEMNKMNTATLVLAALGMLPIVIILLYAVRTLVIRRKHKAQHDLERYISDGQPISPVVKLEQSECSSTTTESIMSDKDFDRSNLRFKSLLGEGNFGQVWKAEADDLAGHLGTTRIVAVKTERVDNGQGGLKAEAEIMKKLGSHPNVVTLLGACTEQEPHLLIMEFAMRGRLLSLLRAARSAINEISVTRTPVMPLSLRRLTGFAHDIARGMEYISDKKIVHRDLAARNVLLDHNGICKICDFGMSVDLDKVTSSHSELRIPRLQHSEPRFNFEFAGRSFGTRNNRQQLNNCNTRTSRPALPIRWMAPEALQYHIYSPETDVWAFGIVLWEIATLGCTPYPNLSGREVVRNIPNGERPDIPPDCRPELYDLMNRTWRKDPRNRPTFAESRMALARALCQWKPDDNIPATGSEYFDVSGFSEDLEHGMVYFNKRVSEFECEI